MDTLRRFRQRSAGWPIGLLVAVNVVVAWTGPAYWLLPMALVDLVALMLLFEAFVKASKNQ